MKFGKLMEMKDTKLFISPRHDKWLEEHPNAEYSQAAMELARRELGKPDRIRTGTISASSLNTCERSQQFKFLGLPQLPYRPQTSNIFHNGTFTHLRWQMAGLSEGWLAQAEVPVPPNPYDLSGTADGLCSDGSLLEIKSINSNGFRGVISFGAKQDHVFQLATYMLTMGIDIGRFIYENKDTQEYVEIPLEMSGELEEQIDKHANDLWLGIHAKELAPMLSKCMDKEGWRYNSCPFRDRCPSVNTWEEAQALA